ncbi:MAG: hypothetical protein FWD34_05635 [Oscillospiraceae bacterium]|nr:hypothetical protein [Oscillospiraceae bacterium]
MERWFDKEIYDAFSKTINNSKLGSSSIRGLRGLVAKQIAEEKRLAEELEKNRLAEEFEKNRLATDPEYRQKKEKEKYENLVHEMTKALSEYDYKRLWESFGEMNDYDEASILASTCEKRYIALKSQREQREHIENENRLELKKNKKAIKKRKKIINLFGRIIACLLAIIAFSILYITYEPEYETREINGQHIAVRNSTETGMANVTILFINIINIVPFLALFFTSRDYRGLRITFLCIGVLFFLIMFGSCSQFEDEFSNGGISTFLYISLVSKIIIFFFPRK